MKALLLAASLVLGAPAACIAQTPDLSPLPVDSTTQRVAISQVVEAPGVSKAELYSRAREWCATSFGSSKAVLEMDDREAGKLIGRFNSPLRMASGVGVSTDMVLWRTIKIEIKDGKYRYSFSNFAMGAPTMTDAQSRPVEQYLKRTGFTYNKDGTPKKMAGSVIEGVRGDSNLLAASLRAAMTKPAAKDW